MVAWPCTTPARLSISESAVDSVSLTQLLAGDARDWVCRWSEFKFHSENEERPVDAARNGSALPGPGLGRLEWPTGGFIRKLFLEGLVRFSRTPKYHCTCFFSTRNRADSVIVHARDVHRHFKRPLALALASPEALGIWSAMEAVASGIPPLTCGTPSIAFPCRQTCRTASPCLGERLVRSTLASSMDSSSAAMITCGVAAVVCHWVSVRRFIWRNRPQLRL